MHRGFFIKADMDAKWKNIERIKFGEEPSRVKFFLKTLVDAFKEPSLPPTGKELEKRERKTMRKMLARVSLGHHCK